MPQAISPLLLERQAPDLFARECSYVDRITSIGWVLRSTIYRSTIDSRLPADLEGTCIDNMRGWCTLRAPSTFKHDVGSALPSQ
jgi:hypothetical protein